MATNELKIDEGSMNNPEPNMATLKQETISTASSGLMLERLLPQKFCRGDNLDAFIKECETFFKFANCSPMQQELMMITFIDKDIRDEYEGVATNVKGIKERLRKAFVKETTLLQDMRRALSYKQTYEEPKKYFETVSKLVNNIMDREWTKEDMMELLLVECSNEKDLKRDICLNDIKGVAQIKERIQKLHDVRKETEEVSAIRMREPERVKMTYADTTKKMNNGQRYEERMTRDQGQQQNQRRVECWTCHEEGHVSRNCAKRIIKCFACGEQGHMRRECPTIKCQRCNKSGHQEKECYTNLNRQRQWAENEPSNNFRRPREFAGYRENTRYQENKAYQGNKGYQGQAQYNGSRQNVGYQGYMEQQGVRRRPGETNGRYINNVEEENFENVGDQRHPNVNASTEEEIVGAIF